ncbi:hypothetical protein FPCIR_11557 [Fusarium pseudocircinatum]|uniref:Uncharacterized protein n=1 Tax=Fusarium pseudocircinatum TaxID=56676 RepID=A0A8H5KTV3_9HYPO|nr:hypothetical protein FPCIR_11557 [Fusarium pseudocircinatum]
MSPQESLETWMATHSQTCKTIENQIREEVDAALRQAYCETGDAVRRALEAAHGRQSTEMARTFDNLEETLRGAGISHYNSSSQSLQDKDIEMAQLREEYEAKLKAKDEEIKALNECVINLRGSCRDKDTIIATAMETNKRQLEQQAKQIKAEGETMRLSMAKQKKDTKRHHQNEKAKLKQQLRLANEEIELERRERRRLAEKVDEYYNAIVIIEKNAKKLSVDRKELAEAKKKALAIEKCINSNKISAILYKLSMETSSFKISPFLEPYGCSFFVQVLDVIVEAGNTNRMRTFVDNVRDAGARCFPSVCTMDNFPKTLITGFCDAHNDMCPKITVVDEKGGTQRTVYFDL